MLSPLQKVYNKIQIYNYRMNNNAFSIIVACEKNGGIGFNGKLPWKNDKDMAYFRKTTLETLSNKKNALIMGRKTFESLNCKPLSGRINLCLTTQNLSTVPNIKNVFFFNSLNSALQYAYNNSEVEKVFVIGGASLYEEAIKHEDCSELLINKINIETNCDTFFPQVDDNKYELLEKKELSDDVTNYRYIKKLII